jgi:tetraacyldisaccharide 4'-kinase
MVTNLLTLLPLLRPLGAVYGFFMRIRHFFYTKSILKSYTFSVPVISVGNLTMGGSGKTPVVIYLARFLQQQGYRPAVVSRGYGGKANGKSNIVSDGRALYLDSIEAGDEPRLIAEKTGGVAVLTGKKRIYPCQCAIDELGCNVIILDDGFQHLSVNRDVDLVLFNATTNSELLHVLPGGILREPFSALHRTSAFIVTGCRDINHSKTREGVSYLPKDQQNKPLFHLAYEPSHYVDHSGQRFELDTLSSKVYAFCGIASPHRFITSLKMLSLNIAGSAFFTDHQHYNETVLNNIVEQAKEHGAAALLTTEKDLVKLKTFNIDFPLYALCMEVPRSHAFETFIMGKLAGNSPFSAYCDS